jgi:hypothetical protein
LLLACSARPDAQDAAAPGPQSVAPLSLESPAAERTSQLLNELRANTSLTGDELRAKHPRNYGAGLNYEPGAAEGLSRIQASTHALEEPELERLAQLGFVVSAKHEFPTMLYAYASFYVQDLPLYVSADSILDAIFRSYDTILADIELNVLLDDLGSVIASLRSALPESVANGATKRDVDLYLAVAQSLLQGEIASAVAGADQAEIAALTEQAQRASGRDKRVLLGVERDIDFSQLKPRGHYAKLPQLARYFQALSWLSRTDLRLIETLPSGERVFRREQFAAAVLLRQLMDAEALASYRRIDETLAAFAGRSDSMRVFELDALRADLGLANWDDASELDSARIAQTILDKGYGAQQIASQLIVNKSSDGRTLPLARTFALFGQRYTVDSHVLSNVVYDVVPDRLMPDPLDAAYAAFGNDAALTLLGPDLDQYAGPLESTRRLVDLHEPSYWSESLYTSWLQALRKLSPSQQGDPALPGVTRSAAWDARLLNTQLASWAQLRHSTTLYAKPSYTTGLLCEYPDAYVEPYPAFFDALEAFARRGTALAETLSPRHEPLGGKLAAYFKNLASAMSTLGAMARSELSGQPLSDSQLAFINDAIRKSDDCPGSATFDGWYAGLDYAVMENGRVSSEMEPIVADIHTQPTDASGNDVGRVLHVGVGLPRLLVVTTDTCQGPHAYAGVVSTYSQLTTEHWQRLNDAEWAGRILGDADEAVDVVPWTRSFLGEQTER